MDEHKMNLESDLNNEPDRVKYEVRFYKREEESKDLILYETLNMSSPPMLPEVGDEISFEFITDGDGNMVYREDGEIPKTEIRTDGEYTHKTSFSFKVADIDTTYRKCVNDEDGLLTVVSKTVTIEKFGF